MKLFHTMELVSNLAMKAIDGTVASRCFFLRKHVKYGQRSCGSADTPRIGSTFFGSLQLSKRGESQTESWVLAATFHLGAGWQSKRCFPKAGNYGYSPSMGSAPKGQET